MSLTVAEASPDSTLPVRLCSAWARLTYSPSLIPAPTASRSFSVWRPAPTRPTVRPPSSRPVKRSRAGHQGSPARSTDAERAEADFRDATGRPGPASWELSRYAAGRENHPVQGVSWFEAVAFCEWEGKSLPTFYHWKQAAGVDVRDNMLAASNIATTSAAAGPVPVGSSEAFGVNHLGAGTVDIAVGDKTIGFAAVNMAAGDVASGQLEVVNGGSLPLRFVVSASSNGGPLSTVLELVAWRGTSECASTPPSSATRWRPLLEPVPDVNASPAGSPTTGRLAPQETSLLCMRGELPRSAANSVQGQRLDLLITVTAVHDIEQVLRNEGNQT